jgi:uncharacterized protein (TIGR00255 family)
MRSMTGYGEATAPGKRARVTVQIRTVNHRHLDIQIRAPREYFSLEEETRKAVRQEVARGRVEVWITRAPARERSRKMELDEELARQYLRALQQVQKKFRLKGDLDLSLVSRLPELFQIREEDSGGENEGGLVLRALRTALRNLRRSREREGRHLARDIRTQVSRLQGVQAELEKESGKIRTRLLDAAASREGVLGESSAEGPESAGSGFKGDIHEEIVRLKSHLNELALLAGGEKDPVGKRLDFLLQEIHRELNTIGAKAPQLDVIRRILEGKERVEKIREQAQNVE